MDNYLPADFYRLRGDLLDWRDASATNAETEKKFDERTLHPADTVNACADPTWRVF
jgi:hypothetical protein